MRTAHRFALFSALMVLALVGAVVLYQNPPEGNSLYPQCQFYRLTGWHCSGCGATRCVHEMLHLRFEEAARKNLLALVALPVLGFHAMRGLWRWVWPRARTAPVRPISPALAITIAVVIVVFGIVRNFPWPPFSWLAPH